MLLINVTLDKRDSQQNLNEVYRIVEVALKEGKIKIGESFSSPELADYLRKNHFYLRKNQITPDHFRISEDPDHHKRYIIEFFISNLETTNKYRKLEFQKNFNITYQHSLLSKEIELVYDSKLEKKSKEFTSVGCARRIFQRNN